MAKYTHIIKAVNAASELNVYKSWMLLVLSIHWLPE